MGSGTMPPRFFLLGGRGPSSSSFGLSFSWSSSVSSESSESLSRPAATPEWFECVEFGLTSCGGGEGDGELRGSRETVELGIVYGDEEGSKRETSGSAGAHRKRKDTDPAIDAQHNTGSVAP